jgi:hypothetical protein
VLQVLPTLKENISALAPFLKEKQSRRTGKFTGVAFVTMVVAAGFILWPATIPAFLTAIAAITAVQIGAGVVWGANMGGIVWSCFSDYGVNSSKSSKSHYTVIYPNLATLCSDNECEFPSRFPSEISR